MQNSFLYTAAFLFLLAVIAGSIKEEKEEELEHIVKNLWKYVVRLRRKIFNSDRSKDLNITSTRKNSSTFNKLTSSTYIPPCKKTNANHHKMKSCENIKNISNYNYTCYNEYSHKDNKENIFSESCVKLLNYLLKQSNNIPPGLLRITILKDKSERFNLLINDGNNGCNNKNKNNCKSFKQSRFVNHSHITYQPLKYDDEKDNSEEVNNLKNKKLRKNCSDWREYPVYMTCEYHVPHSKILRFKLCKNPKNISDFECENSASNIKKCNPCKETCLLNVSEINESKSNESNNCRQNNATNYCNMKGNNESKENPKPVPVPEDKNVLPNRFNLCSKVSNFSRKSNSNSTNNSYKKNNVTKSIPFQNNSSEISACSIVGLGRKNYNLCANRWINKQHFYTTNPFVFWKENPQLNSDYGNHSFNKSSLDYKCKNMSNTNNSFIFHCNTTGKNYLGVGRLEPHKVYDPTFNEYYCWKTGDEYHHYPCLFLKPFSNNFQKIFHEYNFQGIGYPLRNLYSSICPGMCRYRLHS